ncbi:hypothetical protein CEXT_780661 [Caerostris extrusa]|uniref:Uncharacterized protein n=1 Tax=Caerostris extrusa TaxID=172846 RepID=A0AAV4TUW5_CAEEX|nr:hypothetical protein CEXT_780661 [Caerostris extrusa]
MTVFVKRPVIVRERKTSATETTCSLKHGIAASMLQKLSTFILQSENDDRKMEKGQITVATYNSNYVSPYPRILDEKNKKVGRNESTREAGDQTILREPQALDGSSWDLQKDQKISRVIFVQKRKCDHTSGVGALSSAAVPKCKLGETMFHFFFPCSNSIP